VGKDEQRLTDYVLPVLTGKTMHQIEQAPELLLDVKKALNERVLRAKSGEDPKVKRFSATTARRVWEALTCLFGEASSHEDRKIRVITRNPASGFKGPTPGREKEKQWLFPREFARLIACTDTPLGWRQAYAVATYLFLRVAELRALHCEDIDFESGMVRVHRATKKKSVRHFRLEPEVIPLLKHLAAQADGKGRLFRLPVEREMAEGRANQTEIIGAGKQARRLRDRLTAAGVTRDALHNTTEQAVQITFHDLRATGVTRCALRGDSMISIRDRAGHTDVEQTNDYVRRASSGQRRIAVPQASKLCIPQQLPAPQFICAGYCAGN
jgi:integrase